MQILIYILFVSILTLDYFSRVLGIISSYLTIFPELLSIVVTILIAIEFAKKRSIEIEVKYVIFFLLFGLHLVNGILLNDASVGAIIAGMRIYLKYIPFFLLPMVYQFSEKNIRYQLNWLLFLLLIQCPIAVLQRFVFYKNVPSGDVVRGTMATGSFLSILLISGIAITLGFYLKKRISLRLFISIVLLLFIPTTINETKGSLILLPIALFVPALITKWEDKKPLKLISVAFIGISSLVGFVKIYDYMGMEGQQNNMKISKFFTDENELKHYLAPKSSGMVTRNDAPAGRLDTIIAPLERFSNDPIHLLVGIGMGNVTNTSFGLLSGGELKLRQEGVVDVAASYLLWEIGLGGLLLSFVLLAMFFSDARHVSAEDGIVSDIALGWVGVVLIISIGLFYKDIIRVNGIMYLFWYFSGHIVAERFRIKRRGPLNEYTLTTN